MYLVLQLVRVCSTSCRVTDCTFGAQRLRNRTTGCRPPHPRFDFTPHQEDVVDARVTLAAAAAGYGCCVLFARMFSIIYAGNSGLNWLVLVVSVSSGFWFVASIPPPLVCVYLVNAMAVTPGLSPAPTIGAGRGQGFRAWYTLDIYIYNSF